tara:strand:- start:239 stop:772 length:534 start_codon:yes stop_codon:yes gene_type:complete
VIIDLFSTPIFIGNIDSSKIKLKSSSTSETFVSELQTTFNVDTKISEESVKYLLDTVVKLLNEKLTQEFEVSLQNIWENKYKNNDFQDVHIHPGAHLSFIIYKKIKSSNTVFFHPSKNLLGCFYDDCWKKTKLFGPQHFEVQCRENQMVVFPSFLEHMVKKTSDAVTIAGNLFLTIK